MNLLGYDTSTAASAAAVLRGDGELFEAGSPPSGARAHAKELLPAATAAMERAGLDWPQLDAIAVGIGPGGFTGLRIGIATASCGRSRPCMRSRRGSMRTARASR